MPVSRKQGNGCVDVGFQDCNHMWTSRPILTFRRNIFQPWSSRQWMFLRTFGVYSQVHSCYKPEDQHWHIYQHANLKSHCNDPSGSNFLTASGTLSLSRRTLLHWVCEFICTNNPQVFSIFLCLTRRGLLASDSIVNSFIYYLNYYLFFLVHLAAYLRRNTTNMKYLQHSFVKVCSNKIFWSYCLNQQQSAQSNALLCQVTHIIISYASVYVNKVLATFVYERARLFDWTCFWNEED